MILKPNRIFIFQKISNYGAGGFGGLSWMTNGFGCSGGGGFWMIRIGDAGGAWTSDSWIIVISPALGGGGGL